MKERNPRLVGLTPREALQVLKIELKEYHKGAIAYGSGSGDEHHVVDVETSVVVALVDLYRFFELVDQVNWYREVIKDKHIAGGGSKIIKFNTATCMSASSQPIGTPLHHSNYVNSVTFSADGKFLVTSCNDNHIYIWDVSAIVKEPDLLPDNVDATPRLAPKITGVRRIPPGFFDDTLREANYLRIRQSQSNGPNNHPTPTPRQRTLTPFSSFWRHSKTHRATEPDPQPQSHSLSWTRSLVSHMLRRQNASDIQLREQPVVDVPYTAGKLRNYHARGKPAASLSRLSNTHTMQQHPAFHSTLPSSQQLSPTAAALTPSAVSGAGTAGTISRPHITGAGWHARFVG
ncbi:hypothetical protein EDB19DRAFT_1941282 [Suillus lakei]|nr:hypothetical protein EDB19DRAFT_1941282 [Suillus lakei]